MEPLELNKHIFIWLNIYPIENDENKWSKYLYHLIYGVIVISIFVAFATSLVFILKNIETDIVNSLYALIQVAALFSGVYMCIVSFVQRNKIVEIFMKLQKIHDTCMNFNSIS